MRSWLCILALCLAALSCKRTSKPLDDKNTAINLLNRRQYSDAILVLEGILQRSPNEDEVKLLLASAHAGWAGLNTFDAYDVLGPFLNKQIKDKDSAGGSKALLLMPQKIKIASQAHEESLPEDSQGKEDEEHTRALIHKLEKLILHHLTSFSSAFSLAFRLPHTPTLERKRLVAALLLIDQIKVDSPVYIRAQTYAAVINMIQYLNYMRDAFPGIVTLEGQKIEEFVCHFDLGILLSNIDNLNFYLTNAVQALNQAVAVDDRHSVSHTLLKVHEQVRNIKDSLNERDDELFLADFAHRFLLSAQCKDLQAE